MVDASAYSADGNCRFVASAGGDLMPDARTIAFYDTAADHYADLTDTDAPDANLLAFMALLPQGGQVLDLGCGPAHASVHMRDAGFRPDPVDASTGMVTLANETYDIGARLLTFDAIDMVAAYDGVWANFSLLHAPRAALPIHLDAIATALRPQGILHVGMKTGAGELRDRIDRKYTFVTVPELTGLLEDAGFDIIDMVEGREKGCAGTVDPFVVMRARKHA
ncbi:class I SAM-dependent methyltransferase [Yoonia sp. SS1-5]|uniref:Class I SAM-dependent methyltransferase n=1 Tax=Yoonia rhodophyticola TaxID=3137370 RepID=A0AAN0MD81_9RHOB